MNLQQFACETLVIKANIFAFEMCKKIQRSECTNGIVKLLWREGSETRASDMNFIDFILQFVWFPGVNESQEPRINQTPRQSIKFPMWHDRKLTRFSRVEVFNLWPPTSGKEINQLSVIFLIRQNELCNRTALALCLTLHVQRAEIFSNKPKLKNCCSKKKLESHF